MKRAYQVLCIALVILPWLAGARVQADLIQWSASGNPIGPNLSYNGTARIYPQNGADSVIQLSPGNATSGINSGSVVALRLGYGLVPDATVMPTFGGPSANYALSLSLQDRASGDSGSLTFRGNLSGRGFTDGLLSLTNTFLGSTTQTLTLGHDLYTVTIGPFVISPYQYAGQTMYDGSISASISAQPLTNSTPEPSSLLLACLGLPSLGLAGWFRRRKTVDSDTGKT